MSNVKTIEVLRDIIRSVRMSDKDFYRLDYKLKDLLKPDGLTLTIGGTGKTQHFMEMLAWIELLGKVGHSTSFKVYIDGDGSSRWQFQFEDKEEQKKFMEIQRELCKQQINEEKDIEYFEI